MASTSTAVAHGSPVPGARITPTVPPRALAGAWRTTALAALGLAGSLLVAGAAPGAVADRVVGWWYAPAFLADRGTAVALVYAGMAILCLAWLALGRGPLPSRRALVAIAAVWTLPLALAPPLFSRDVYSYLAQGTIMHLGHSPYDTAPAALAALGRPHVLAAVSPFWSTTTAPYGPLFLGLVSLVVAAVGSHLVAGVLLTRLTGIAGLALLAICVPRLARAVGSDPRRALWLVALSPLVTLELIAPGHNDLLMAGVLAAAVACALAGQPLAGVALCALAATIKLPALAGAAFIAVAWARAEPDAGARARLLVQAALVAAAVLAAVTLITGTGLGWLSSSVFSTPAKVRLAITPATAVGYSAAGVLGHLGVAVSARALEGALGLAAAAVTAALGLALLWRVRIATLVASLGVLYAIAAAGGPAAWPWYFAWSLALAGALRAVQRSPMVALAIVASAFVVKPDGILTLSRGAAPFVLLAYAVAAAAWWWRHRGAPSTPERASVPARA